MFIIQITRSYKEVMKKDIILTQEQRNLKDVLHKPEVTYLDKPFYIFFTDEVIYSELLCEVFLSHLLLKFEIVLQFVDNL